MMEPVQLSWHEQITIDREARVNKPGEAGRTAVVQVA